MDGLYFLVPTLLVVFVSFLIVRAAAIALMMTGMDRKRAVFQALSAFSGTGFTTKKAESIVNHPERRRIVSWLMILGNAGIVTVIITATSSLVTSKGYQLSINVLVLLVGIYLIYKIATHKGFIGNSLSESKLTEKGFRVLGIERGKNWIPIPKAKEMIQEGDRIVVYGPIEVLRALFREE
ncbi:MAG: TrkA C-terminal domain-containing protein [Halobacteriota archaeon]